MKSLRRSRVFLVALVALPAFFLGARTQERPVDPPKGPAAVLQIPVFLVQHAGFPGDGGQSHGAWKLAALQQFGR